jgi:fibro-slime domain-containing protein
MEKRFFTHCLFTVLFCLVFGGMVSTVYGQTYGPPTITVPVTFYDFRSDRSNPEFEQPHDENRLNFLTANGKSIAAGMVDSLLDADNKPRLGPYPYMNHGVRFWFREWDKLDQYKMFDTVRTVDGVTRGYLDRFRPLYMYRRQGDAGNQNDGSNEDNGAYTAYPPLPYARELGERNGHAGNLGWFMYNDELNNPFRSNANSVNAGNITTGNVPYIYAAGGLPAAIQSGGSHIRDGAVFTQVGTAGNNSSSRLNFGTSENYDYTIDSAFSNIRIDTVLTFRPVDRNPGIYEFESENFFPLSGKGFTNDDYNWISVANTQANRDKNSSFTMEMVRNFWMYDGLVLDFRSDSDMWIFVNGKLALDLGGIHESADGSINFNNIRNSHGLVDGTSYELKIFYVKRHSTAGSSIRIQINSLLVCCDYPPIMRIGLSSDTLKAGEVVVGTANFFDLGDNIIQNPQGNFQWWVEDVTPGIVASERNSISNETLKLVDAKTGQPITSGALTDVDSVLIYAEKAYTHIRLTVRCDLDGLSKDTAIIIHVKPGDPAKVYIEPSPDSSRTLRGARSALRTADPIDTIRIAGNATVNNHFYGIVRDKFGNWIQPAGDTFSSAGNPPYNGTATWSLSQITGHPAPEAIASIESMPVPDEKPSKGQCIVTKVGAGLAMLNLKYYIPKNSNGFAGLNDSTFSVVFVEGNTAILSPDRINPQIKQETEITLTHKTDSDALTVEFIAGPNPVLRGDSKVGFFLKGKRVKNAAFTVYDASGNIINKIKINDRDGITRGNLTTAYSVYQGDSQSKRIVGSWDLKDKKGRLVGGGTYLVKGVITTIDGKKEKVSVIVGVH